MKCSCILFLGILGLSHGRAAQLGNIVDFTPVAGWKQANMQTPQAPTLLQPTIEFVPTDNRHIEINLTLFPSNLPGHAVTDISSLEQFNLMGAKPYLPTSVTKPVSHDLKIADGTGLYITNEDRELIGKQTLPNEFRFATTVTLFVGGKFLILGTILHDQKDSADFREALQILQSEKMSAAAIAAIEKDAVARSDPADKLPPFVLDCAEETLRNSQVCHSESWLGPDQSRRMGLFYASQIFGKPRKTLSPNLQSRFGPGYLVLSIRSS